MSHKIIAPKATQDMLPTVQRALQVWGIGEEWEIVLATGEAIPGDAQAVAACQVDTRYMQIVLHLAPSLLQHPDAEHISQVIYHEVGHAALALAQQVVTQMLRVVEHYQGEVVAGILRESYESEIERMLQRHTLALPHYSPPPRP